METILSNELLACPSLPDCSLLRNLQISRLEKKLHASMILLFKENYPEPNIIIDRLNEAIKLSKRCSGGIAELVCGRYLMEELYHIFDQTGHAPTQQPHSSISNRNRIDDFNFDDRDRDSYGNDDSKRLIEGAELYNKFLVILKVCENASSFVDENGLTLLHHLIFIYGDHIPERNTVQSDSFHRILFMLCRVIYRAYPDNASVLGVTPCFGAINPFQLLLMNQSNYPIDYELAFRMVLHDPTLVKYQDNGGRLPIHHLLSKVNCTSYVSKSYLVLLKHLLSLFPESAFMKVTERIRSIRIHPSNGLNDENSLHPIVLTTITWIPLELGKNSSHMDVVVLFEKFLENLFWRHISSQKKK